MLVRATFKCGDVSDELPQFYDGQTSVISNKDGTSIWTFPILCCRCDLRNAKAEEVALRARYSLQIEEWRAQIKRAEVRIWKGPLNVLLIEAKNERVKAADELECEQEEKVASVWKIFEKRWGAK